MPIDRHSQTWVTLRHVIEEDIEKYRARLEAHGLDIAETEFARGYLRACRDVLKLGDPDKRPEIKTGDPVDYN